MTHIRSMTAADLSFGLGLSRQAGWNQIDADWRRTFELEPDGCFVAERDGKGVGTATTCLFGPVAWVAMVLVDAGARRQGIGRALMEHALRYLDSQGVATVRLDATPLGQPLYEQLGFTAQFRLARYEGVLDKASQPATDDYQVSSRHWYELLALDAAVTRTDRRKLLLRLFAERPGQVRAALGLEGWVGLLTAREGARAVQLGPCLGAAGPTLLADAFRRHAGRRVYLDVPEDNHAACRLAEVEGLTVQRHLLRMCRGQAVVEQVELLWASSGPEKG